MTNKILITEMDGTPAQISFADHSGDFSPSTGSSLEFGTPTNGQIALASLADTNAVQSDKVDLGANRAQTYKVRAAFEFAATPTAGEVVELYWGASSSSIAERGNPGGISGSSSAYSGYASDLKESVRQLDFIGVFVCAVEITPIVQISEISIFTPSERYGVLVVKNESAASFHSDDVECHVVFDPIVPELQ